MKKALLSMVMAFALVGAMAGCAQAPDGNAPADGTGTAGQAVEAACQSEDANAGSEVRSYVVSHVDGEPDWESIPQLEIDNQQWLEPVVITAHAQLCYSDEAFYVRMWAEEANVRAEYPESDLLAKTYEDSCLEFFISPVPGDSRYLNFEFNPNCAVGAEIGATKAGRTRLVRSDDPYNAAATRTENGWEITYQVPFDLIRQLYPDFSAESGTTLRGNFYKCGNLTVQKHYLSWNPIKSDTPNFHLPEYFGELVLE